MAALDELSARQREVFMGIAEGKRPSDIAREMCITRTAVNNHRMAALFKLGMRSSYDIIRFAIKTGLVP